jgi:hypothetical protein
LHEPWVALLLLLLPKSNEEGEQFLKANIGSRLVKASNHKTFASLKMIQNEKWAPNISFILLQEFGSGVGKWGLAMI